ncbi:DUF2079 domain-containing protein [Aureliella helgolandensis]|uniref:DUF2079 domain-containing protein n=1 Tax=Aureliella helgolandensis TaxID=2527968 RepID=A0A518GCD3_9BACT|nr:DUF2079 domain-containing protein [Aureliella helgolandensis]QDV26248.1 hypothetical protein Q31a_46200 [Aureliella helgolandensis]
MTRPTPRKPRSPTSSRRRSTPTASTKSTSALASAPKEAAPLDAWVLLWGVIASLNWCLAASALASRNHLVMGYRTLVAGPPQLEPLMVSQPAFLAILALASAWFFAFWRHGCSSFGCPPRLKIALLSWSLAALPFGLSLLQLATGFELERLFWETLWLSGWTGFSFVYLVAAMRDASMHDAREAEQGGSPRQPALRQPSKVTGRRLSLALVVVGTVLTGSLWFAQSHTYYNNFQLGFNDFAHFTQRIANTAAGRGVLMETPVLPPFWDHFNPGLLLLVPLWELTHDVHFIFAVQAVALTSGGLIVRKLALQSGHGDLNSAAWGLAWLAQPVLGQMNIAYTYGWHPISLALPLLLGSLSALLAGRLGLAAGAAVLAMSMEEGVIVAVTLFSAAAALQCTSLFASTHRLQPNSGEVISNSDNTIRPTQTLGLSLNSWIGITVVSGLTFFAVYQWSGIAEFQTGRFVALGNSATEVILSPILKPAVFWGQLLQWKNLAFILCLLLPCNALGLALGWRWCLACILPLGVLCVWDHLPATCLAFQYSSTLLPILWFATLQGASRLPAALSRGAGVGALACGLTLSLFVGQLPYSSASILDVESQSYAGTPNFTRQADSDDGRWLLEQVAAIRNSGAETLATGRIAAHLVGNADIETVGQFLQRRPQLSLLPDRRNQPLQHYRWILLDRVESFQQSPEETARIEAEARALGFQSVADKYDIVLLELQ